MTKQKYWSRWQKIAICLPLLFFKNEWWTGGYQQKKKKKQSLFLTRFVYIYEGSCIIMNFFHIWNIHFDTKILTICLFWSCHSLNFSNCFPLMSIFKFGRQKLHCTQQLAMCFFSKVHIIIKLFHDSGERAVNLKEFVAENPQWLCMLPNTIVSLTKKKYCIWHLQMHGHTFWIKSLEGMVTKHTI